MKLTPLAAAKKRFGIDEKDPTKARKATKTKLVAAVKKHVDGGLWTDGLGDKGLEHVSNAKLLRLLDVLDTIKSEFKTRDALVKAILEAEGRKDATFSKHFADWSSPRLWDRLQAARKRS